MPGADTRLPERSLALPITGVAGQEVTVLVQDANTTVDFTGTTLKGNAGGDWSPANGDFMRCTFDGTNWYCSVHDATA